MVKSNVDGAGKLEERINFNSVKKENNACDQALVPLDQCSDSSSSSSSNSSNKGKDKGRVPAHPKDANVATATWSSYMRPKRTEISAPGGAADELQDESTGRLLFPRRRS